VSLPVLRHGLRCGSPPLFLGIPEIQPQFVHPFFALSRWNYVTATTYVEVQDY